MSTAMMCWLVLLQVGGGADGGPAVSEPEWLPPLSDLERFPDREVVLSALKINQSARTFLDGQILLYHSLPAGRDATRALEQTTGFLSIWEVMYNAQAPAHHADERRRCLKDLLLRIGPVAYSQGILPYPIPAWYFGYNQ